MCIYRLMETKPKTKFFLVNRKTTMEDVRVREGALQSNMLQPSLQAEKIIYRQKGPLAVQRSMRISVQSSTGHPPISR